MTNEPPATRAAKWFLMVCMYLETQNVPVFLPPRQQAEELFLTNQFEFSAHECDYLNVHTRHASRIVVLKKTPDQVPIPSTETLVT